MAAKVENWLSANADDIEAGELRRGKPLPETEPTRLASLARWSAMSEQEALGVAEKLGIQPSELTSLLSDPVGFAWESLATLLCVKGLLYGGELPPDVTPQWQLEPTVLEHFHLAVDEYGWDAHEAVVTLEAGICFEERRRAAEHDGPLRKPPLTKIKSWKELYDRECKVDAN